MDPLTHALASYTLKRGAFPRLARPATIAMVVAGTVADIDLLSAHVGPSAYITWSRTFCHSLVAAVVFSLLAAVPFSFWRQEAPAQTTRGRYNFGSRGGVGVVFVAALAAAVLHLLFDVCQAQGVELLWPFTRRRFALDWVAHLDLLILGILIAALALPKLAGLVSDEIGAKSKGPRGRGAAVAALAAVVLYVCFRAALHSAAITALDSRTYRGEAPLRVAAFPETNVLLTWSGVVETERAIREVAVPSFSAGSFDPDSARTIYKPEPSPALDAALKTATARRFIAYARFPRASIEKTPDGYRVRLQTYAFDPDFRIQAVIEVSSSAEILGESLSYDFGARSR